MTYTPIASITLGSNASSVTFSSIPQDYRDLVIMIDNNINSTTGDARFQFNGDTDGNYYRVTMSSGVDSGTSSGVTFYNPYRSAYSSFWGYVTVMDYTATDKHKSLLARIDNVGEYTSASAGRWADTSAVTSVTISTRNSYLAGSTFTLYGIEA